ncbi:hypothetical protein CH274_20040 [Rhodococcus sp. 06-418-5]|nr:hypothetical protein CH274_20040 [Rhodococcus sp. 06-418-5]
MILDRTAAPMLAPDNFDCSRIDGPTENGVRKLAPSAGNTFLQQHLSEAGPYAATARYLDPRTTADGRWRVRVDSHSAYPATLDTFTALANRLRIRGVVDTRFVPLSLDLEGRTATLVYQLTGSPALYDAHVPIPTKPELRVPPTDQTWGARYGYHPPVFHSRPINGRPACVHSGVRWWPMDASATYVLHGQGGGSVDANFRQGSLTAR